jgi:hypothetical protein
MPAARIRKKLLFSHFQLPTTLSVIVSNHLNPATNNHIKCHHFGEAQIGNVGSAVSRRWELTDVESAQDGGTSGNHRACAAELVISPDRC